jgi:uncharacterized membrane protein
VANDINKTAYEKMTKNSKKVTQETNTHKTENLLNNLQGFFMTENQNQYQILLNVMFVVSFLKPSKSLQSE